MKTKDSLTKKIEILFEQSNVETHHNSENYILDKLQLRYESVENDKLLENISYLATNMSTAEENWNIFFTRLIPFFEIGFFFDNGLMKNQFLYGKTIPCENKTLKLQLPKSDLFQILKTDPKSLFIKLQISNILQSDKMNSFYVRVDQNIGFILATTKAEPWLKLKMDSLQKALINHQL